MNNAQTDFPQKTFKIIEILFLLCFGKKKIHTNVTFEVKTTDLSRTCEMLQILVGMKQF